MFLYPITGIHLPLFANKRKLKGEGISLSESLTKSRLVKLNEARDQHRFGKVWEFGPMMETYQEYLPVTAFSNQNDVGNFVCFI